MSILVTGGTGAIGSWVTRMLVEQGYDCVVMDIAPNMSLLEGLNRPELKIEKCDITDLSTVLEVVKRHGVKRIIHTAAIILDDAERNPGLAQRINCIGTMNLLDACRLYDVERMVFTSTGGVLGPTFGEYGHPQYKPMTEEHLKNPVGMYAYTKIFCEGLGLTCSGTYGIDFVALRFKSLYGPIRYRHAAVARLDRMISQALLGKPIVLPSNSHIKNDWTYTKDCARALQMVCLSTTLRNKIYHVGTGRGVSLGEVAEILQQLIPGSTTRTESNPKEEASVTGQGGVLDYGRAKTDFGYEPMFQIQEGLRDYLSVLKQFHLEPVQF